MKVIMEYRDIVQIRRGERIDQTIPRPSKEVRGGLIEIAPWLFDVRAPANVFEAEMISDIEFQK
jgi:hypothetical protein